MEEYQEKFMRGGKQREAPAERKIRQYTMPEKPQRRHPPKYQEGLPRPEDVEGFPKDIPGARLQRQGKILYVITAEYYRSAGVTRHIYHYHGRVKDLKFYTMEEYRATFDRYGNARKKAVAAEKEDLGYGDDGEADRHTRADYADG